MVRWCWPCRKEVKERARKCKCGHTPLVFPFTTAAQVEWFRSQKYKYMKWKFAERWDENEYPLPAKYKGDARSKDEIKAEEIMSRVLWEHYWLCPVARSHSFILDDKDKKVCLVCGHKLYRKTLEERRKQILKTHAKAGKKQEEHLQKIAPKGGEAVKHRDEEIIEAFQIYKLRNPNHSLCTAIKNIITKREDNLEYMDYKHPETLLRRLQSIACPESPSQWWKGIKVL